MRGLANGRAVSIGDSQLRIADLEVQIAPAELGITIGDWGAVSHDIRLTDPPHAPRRASCRSRGGRGWGLVRTVGVIERESP